MKDLFTYQFKNGLTLKNRFVVAPMTTYSANEDLTLSDEEEIYYRERGKSFGMVISAATAVSKHAQAFPRQISIKDHSYLQSMKRLAKAIKEGGAKAILQIHHGGRMNASGLYENQDIVSASSIKAQRQNAIIPRALETEEVYEIVEDFNNAIKLAIEAGFDGIELHGANTYLIQQFFSPHSNRRNDEFGGSLEKRMKFPKMLISGALKVKKTYANKEFIIGYRLSPEEYEQPGITIEDTLSLIKEISKTDIDYIHLSLSKFNQSSIRSKSDTKAIVTKVKDVIEKNIALIGVGQIDDLKSAKQALDDGFDLLAVGMASLADPYFVDHLKNNEKPKKDIDQASMLPLPLFERLNRWRGIEDRGFKLKK